MAYEHLGTVAQNAEDGNATVIVGTTSQVVPVGTLLVVGFFHERPLSDFPLQNVSVTDSEGNVYTQAAAEVSDGASTSLHMFSSVTTTALPLSASITATINGNARSRRGIVVEAFSGEWESPHLGQVATANPTGGSTSLEVGPTPALTGSPHLGCALVAGNGGVTILPPADWDAGGHVYTEAGSSNRGMRMVWGSILEDGPATVEVGYSTSQNSRTGLLATFDFVSTSLPTPTGFTFAKVTNQRSINSSWNSVPSADGYRLEVEEFTGTNPNLDTHWTRLGVFDTTTATSITIDEGDGIKWGTTYRGRVRALGDGA